MNTNDYLTQLQQDREDLVDNLETKGITGLTGDETFTELVPQVLNISGGGNLQEKTLTIPPTVNQYEVLPDTGYDGLSKVNVIVEKPYIELQYIESTGTQYIDTGVIPTSLVGFVVKGAVTQENNTDKVMVGCRASNLRFWVDFDGSGGSKTILYGVGSYYGYCGSYVLNEDYEISFNYNSLQKIIINGSETGFGASVPSLVNAPIYLFRANYTPELYGSFKIYYCKIYYGTNLIRDLIPVKRTSDNAICMYDKVSQTFFTNKGTGAFIAGPVAN